MKINYITNVDITSYSGGFSAMNFVVYEALCSLGSVEYAGPIDTRTPLVAKWEARLERLLGRRVPYVTFSAKRLAFFASEIGKRSCQDAHVDFFHGFTPWIGYEPKRPYIAWSDCVFDQYMSIFQNRERICESDLARIVENERRWLANCQAIWFRSHWAAEFAIKAYGLDPSKVHYVGNCGFIDPPEVDTYTGGLELLFVSTDFKRKGGRVVLSAFEILRQRHPQARLTIVGSAPDVPITNMASVRYVGALSKNKPEQLAMLREHFANACCLVHPTTADINPTVVIEAGYFGCPCISTTNFALPELVRDGVTGILLEDVGSSQRLVDAIEDLTLDQDRYRRFREEVWAHTRRIFSKAAFTERLVGAWKKSIEVL